MMLNRITQLIAIILFVSITGITKGQGLLENNNADAKAKQKVKKETLHLEKGGDSPCLYSIKEFDEQGRIVKITEHKDCGKVSCIKEFKYDEDSGKLRAAWVSCSASNFQKVKMVLKKDQAGQIEQIEPSVKIAGYPYVERYSYNAAGKIAKVVILKEAMFSHIVDRTIEWSGDTGYSTTERTRIETEEDGLKWIEVRTFEYF